MSAATVVPRSPAAVTNDGSSPGAVTYPLELADEIERYLQTLRFSHDAITAGLEEAMRYSLLAGGKRVRPVLALTTARALRIERPAVLPLAAAIELIHTFSLIHDDLPALDDDDLRRGRPTSHRAFGEGVAVLAGDALLAEAFKLAARVDAPPARALAAVRVLAAAAATGGLAGGQYADIAGAQLDEAGILRMHRLKTGTLLEASVGSVVELAEPGVDVAARMRAYASQLGVMFQIVDDILDVSGTSAATGKSAGSDARNGRRTLVVDGRTDRAERLADACLERISRVLAGLPCETGELLAIANLVRHRHG